MSVTNQPADNEPCDRCLKALFRDAIRPEMVQPLPERAPLAVDGSGPCCRDCAAADTLLRMGIPEWFMARTATGNDRSEQYRLPGALMGLVKIGIMQPNQPGDFARHLEWLERHGLAFDAPPARRGRL